MSSPTGQGSYEKGNVARIVDRLSKQDFSTLARAENVPLKANRAGIGSASAFGAGGNGVVLLEGVSASPDGADVLSGQSDCSNGQRLSKERAVVRFSYAAQQPDELDLKEGDELAVLELAEDGWARGCILHSATNPQAKGRSGLYPTNFVSTVSPTPTTQSAPLAAHPSNPLHCKIEDTQPAEHIHSPSNISGTHPPSTASTTKGSSVLSSSTISTTTALTNGSGVVQSSNVLPSSLLKGGTAPTVAAGVRRAMSTLVTPTTATAKLVENSEASNSHKTKEYAKVLYNYEASNPDELSLSEGAIVTVVSRHCEEEDWFIAEHEGRRGLFPDNFVRFLDHGQMQASPNAQPPSLPVKPSKFGGFANSSNIIAPQNSRNSINVLVKPSTENAKTSATEMHQSVVVERASQSVAPKSLLTTNASDALKGNALSNRHSVIEGLQKQLFPNGKLPPQRPPQPNLGAARPPGTGAAEANTEPKLQKEAELSTKLLVSTSSIVKSRTNIAPSNKRPPSKVNSAATLIDADNNLFTLQQQNTFSDEKKAIQTKGQSPMEETGTDAITPSDGTPSTVVGAMSASSTTNKTTVFSTRPSSPVLQPPISCALSSDDQHQQRGFSSSPTNVFNKPLRPQHSPHLPSEDHSNCISRAEFDLYRDEQERKLVALKEELKELRCMIDGQQK